MKATALLAMAAILANSGPLLALDRCGGDAGFSLPDHGQQRMVYRRGEALVFTSGLRVNTAGAPNNYHPIGKDRGALNSICNGIAVYPVSGSFAGQRISAIAPPALLGPQRYQIILDVFRASRDTDYAIPNNGRIDWFAIAHHEPSDGRYHPCIQANGAFAGFFAAQTSRPADPSRDVCDPEPWISSTAVPYFTLPGSRLATHGVHRGDVAFIFRNVNNSEHLVVAVAGDTGNVDEIGEGSIALHRSPSGFGKLVQ